MGTEPLSTPSWNHGTVSAVVKLLVVVEHGYG